MKMENSKTVLKVATVLDLVFGCPMILLGVVGLIGAGVAAANPEILEGAEVLAMALLGGGGIVVLLIGAFSVLLGVLAWRAAKDPSKIMPVWGTSLALLVIRGLALIHAASMSEASLAGIIGFLFTGLVFYAANCIRMEVGK